MAELNHYNFESLPDFIKESKHCENWRELFPNETIFSCSADMYLENLEINTPEDFEKIIKCEALHLFTQDSRITILKNIETFWMESSFQIELPQKGVSWFGDQIICLFETKGDPFMLAMACMKHNYADLFEYIFQRYGKQIFVNNSFLCQNYSLLIYPIVNDNIDLMIRAIELGYLVTFDLFEDAIAKKNMAIINILIEKCAGLRPKTSTFCYAVKNAPRNIFALMLDAFIPNINEFCFETCKKKILIDAMQNIENLKELFVTRGLKHTRELGEEMLKKALDDSRSLEVVQFIENYMGYTLDDLRKVPKCKYLYYPNGITERIVETDNYDLYMYMREKNFLVNEQLLRISIEKRRTKITPGLIKLHIKEDLVK
jgi:hypothetical protein